MSEQRFQLHLSTLIILLMAVGLLLGLNIREHPRRGGAVAYGFPIVFWTNHVEYGNGTVSLFYIPKFYPEYLAFNAAFTVTLLSGITALCEWRIRRQ